MTSTAARVGLVLVSHSRALAEGAAEVAAAMGLGEVPVRPAGGDDSGGLGTSLARLEAAVAEAQSGAGVVVLADVGSSVLLARTYVADLPDDVGAVVLADAPLVEGAVAAASASATGAGVGAVAAAATDAYDHRKL